ncbi:MAG: M48 family metalloprotease [Planctomycetota bacterium]
MPLQFPSPRGNRGFPFPQRQRTRQGQRRPTFGRSAGGGLKARLLIALAIAAFAFISYYSKQKDVNETTGESERVAMTDEAQEIQLGLQAAPQMVSQHGGVTRSAADQDVVDRVGWTLLRALDLDLETYNQDNPGANRRNPYLKAFQFVLLADKRTVNAFALPGGKVFITHALYDQLETEGQLAGVLGHEIGHVIMRHGNQRMAKQGLYQGLAGAMGVLGGDGQAGGMGQMIASALSMKYGRDHELESDDWGVKLCGLAGYDPRAMKGVMRILDKAAGGQGPPEFLSTHPKPENRVAYIDKAIQKYFPDGVPGNLRP